MNLQLAVEIAARVAQHWEGLYLNPYLCPAGVPTIGYGTTYYEDGRRVKLTDASITRERAIELLVGQITSIYLPQVIALCPEIDDEEKLAAIIDFAYNLGTTNLRMSNLRRRINAGQWSDVPFELRKWVKGGGKVLRGLQLRREDEILLIG